MPSRPARPSRVPLVLGWLLASLLAALPTSPPALGEDWTPVSQGVDYRLFVLPGPTRAHVARMAVASPGVIIESSIATGELGQGTETVSEMARRYDGSLIAWGGDWGPRARVLVAINGSSFDPESGQPYGGLLHSGWYDKKYGDLAGTTGFVWTSERLGVVRGCVEHPDAKNVVTRAATGERIEFDSINQPREDDGLLLFTPQFGAATPAGEREVEVVVRVERPVGIVPLPRQVPGTVIELRDGHGGTPILFDEVVFAAKGAIAEPFVRGLQEGETLGISQEITDLDFGCKRAGGFDWSKAYAGIGGGFVFLRNGEILSGDEFGATVLDPRTAVCTNHDFVYFVVVDGREVGLSTGMALDDLAHFCRDDLGATWGLNQDGGGSSAMWVDGQLVNSPSDGQERAVANGLMMVAVDPAARSTRFGEGFEVRLQAPAEVRTGPGPTFPALQAVAAGETAFIAPVFPSLLGVFAGGSYWWKAEVAGESGYLPEQAFVTTGDALAWFRLPPPTLAIADLHP